MSYARPPDGIIGRGEKYEGCSAVVFGLVEKDVLCAIMTIIAGVDSGSRVFPF